MKLESVTPVYKSETWPLSPRVHYASVIRKEDRWNYLYLYKLYVNFEENKQLFL